VRCSRRIKSCTIADAISASGENRKWQLREIQAGVRDLDHGDAVSHEQVVAWLKSWGTRSEHR